jgi:aerobic carbon-monoxide dehydrogenase large subunit
MENMTNTSIAEPRGYIGTDIPRLHGQKFVSGGATYSADLIPADCLHVALLRSPHAHATITAVDYSEAKKAHGVVAALSGREVVDMTAPTPATLPFRSTNEGRGQILNRCLAVDKASYVGQPVAVVVAESPHAAQAGAELVRVDYQVREAVHDAERALEPDSVIVHTGWSTNVVAQDLIQAGDLDQAFAAADCVVEGVLSIRPSTAAPIETLCYIGDWDERESRLTLRGTFQNPHTSRWLVSSALNLRETQVRVMAPNMGGTFGYKMAGHPEEVLVGMLSRLTKRPVAFWEERNEALLGAGREQTHRFRIAATTNGQIVAFQNTMIADVGTIGPGNGWSMALVTATVFPTVYRVDNCEVNCTLVATNKAPWQPARGYGKEVANLVMERAIDLLADKLGTDKAMLRRRNLLTKESLPHRLPSGLNLDSGDYPGALDQLLDFFGYARWRERQRSEAALDKSIGIGIAFELTPEGGARPGAFPSGFEAATVRIAPTGDVEIAVGVTSPGGGNETGLAQLVGSVLGLRPEAIRVVQGDTDLTPVGTGNASSRALLYGGPAAFLAASDLRKKVAICAANMLETEASEIVFEDGHVFSRNDPSGRILLRDVALGAHTNPLVVGQGTEVPLEVTRSFQPKNVRVVPDEKGRIATYSSFPYSVHAAAVELDRLTGTVLVLDYAVVHDCGVMVNPRLVVGQLKGAIVMGIGAALWEELTYEPSGRLLSDRFKTYLLPRAIDLPEIRVAHKCTPSPFHPLGMKGAGESGLGGALASVSNAVTDALGPIAASLKDVPATPPRLRALMQGSRA